MNRFIEIFKERSTYQGLTVLWGLAGITVSPDNVNAILSVGAAAFAALHIIFPQSGTFAALDAAARRIGKVCIALLLVVGLAAPLSACGTLGSADQGSAGIAKAEIEVALDPSGKPYLRKGLVINGKEYDDVEFSLTTPEKWEVKYSAKNARAFPAHAVRAQVEEVVAKEFGQAVPSLVDGIMKIMGVP
jgi:hypothetical protein